MTGTSFEREWRRRFTGYGVSSDDDADVAGWSRSGLRARVNRFLELWHPTPPGIWADVGCGAGTYSRLMATFGMRVIGVDYSLPSLARAKVKASPDIHWVGADALQLPFRAASCDGALCFGVTQALSGSDRLIESLAELVRPGGELWIDALNKWCLPHLVAIAVGRVRGASTRLRYESPWGLRRLLRSRGLVDVELYWLPILPGWLARVQVLLEARFSRWLFAHVPGLGPLLCHAVVLKGRQPLG